MRTCLFCGEEFEPLSEDDLFCSELCAKLAAEADETDGDSFPLEPWL